MTGAAMVDRPWTAAIHDHRWTPLERLMGDSIFEGEALGVNDPLILLLIGVMAIYYLGWRRPDLHKIVAWRAQAGFAIVSTLIIGVYMVHGLKWIVGRARPDLVFHHGWAYSHWVAFGPHFVTDGIFRGAFPSGHTAQTFLLMTVAFILCADPLLTRSARVAGWVWGVVTMGLSLTMGIARCMSLSHWLADILGAILFGWILMHLLYFKVLRVPEQRRYMATFGHMPDLPPVWELSLCGYLLLGTVGTMMAIIGCRALLISKGPWLALIIPVGAMLIWLCVRCTGSLLHTLSQALNLPNKEAER